MPSGKVFITDYISDPNIESEVLGSNLAQDEKDDVQILLVWHHNIDANYLNNFPNLKGVVRYGVGYDNIDLEELKKRNIIFCNTPDYGVDEVSNTALAMILSFQRRINDYNERARVGYDDGSWQENTLKGIRRVQKTCLGVMGAGRIGSSVALKAKAIGFNVCIYDPFKPSGYEKTLGVSRSYDLEEFLADVDILTIHIPLSFQTQGLINAEFIRKMKPGSSLVNTARGGLVDQLDDLHSALASGYLYGVGLDVLPEEPPRSGLLIDAWKQNDPSIRGRLIINPHSAYYSEDAWVEMRKSATTNALRILKGENPLNIIES